MPEVKGLKVVLIGGGTGSFALLDSLKNYVHHLTALVNMADDGGSTGILRDELGVLPPGDVRQCLVALSRSSQTMRDLFNYRFPKGTFAAGHSFGNLFLTAVEKITDSFPEAISIASEVLNITGDVIPITTDQVTLVLKHSDGTVQRHEAVIDHADFKGQTRPQATLEPHASINPAARQALLDADLIVIAPGSLYSSLAPALIVDGVAEAIAASQARKVYVCNLVTQPGQTDDFKVHDFAAEIERFLGRKDILDFVLYNTAQPNPELLQYYESKGHEFGVAVDREAFKRARYTPIGKPLLSKVLPKQDPNDSLARGFIRHDGDKVARQLLRIYFSE
jgi:uncharacterized cofD-like protein